MKTIELKQMIIDNFIDYYTSDDLERSEMKYVASVYVDDDVDEIAQTFIKEATTENTGGNIMVDKVTLKHSPCVIGISEDCIVLYKDEDSFCNGEDGVLDTIYFPEDTRVPFTNR